MTLQVPTIQELNDLIIAQVEAKLSQTIPLLPKAFNRVIAKVFAGVFIILYKYGGFMFLQMFVETMTNQETMINGVPVKPLTAVGVMMGVGPPTEAVPAEVDFDFTVLLPTGADTLPSGTPILNDASGITYVTIGDTAYGGAGPATETVTIRAASDQQGGNGAGDQGNVDNATVLSFVAPPANVDPDGVVSAQSVTGVDEESESVYKSRIFARFQTPPQGGAYADYSIWGETVTGVINVYPYTGDPGEVDVYSEVSTDLDADGIPDAAKLLEVYNAIEVDVAGLATRRPANAFVNSLAIARTAFTVEVYGITAPSVSEAETAVTAAVEAWFLDREPYIPGWSVGVRKDQITDTAIGGVVQDVMAALGGLFTSVILKEAAVAFQIRTLAAGEKCKATVSYP